MSTYQSTILITGGTVGLGYETALRLAKACPERQIIIASRSNTDNAAETINNKLGQTNVQYMALDLSDPAKIQSFVDEYHQRSFPAISALLLNAGLQFPGPVDFFAGGNEKTFTVNHLGGSLLFFHLLPDLADNARIILTASDTHDPTKKTGMPPPKFTSAAEVARPDPATANKDGRERYTTSKLCNIMWTYSLDRRIQKSGKQWTVNAFNPGLMPGTGLAREYGVILKLIWNQVLPRLLPLIRLLSGANMHMPAESADALTWIALGRDEELVNVSGKYFDGRMIIKSSADSYDEGKQEDLWDWTLKEAAAGSDGQKQSLDRLEF